MIVTLLHHTPLEIADKAIGKCWDKPKEECDVDRIDRVANKHKHSSTIEHITYNFDLDGVSRALLQELARHRMANLSVKSSRYTLKELKEQDRFVHDLTPIGAIPSEAYNRAREFLVFTKDDLVNLASIRALENLRQLIQLGVSNDLAKYCIPEAYKTSLVWTVNARALQNFLALRTNKAALWEIRDLAYLIYENLPNDHKFLFEKNLYKEE